MTTDDQQTGPEPVFPTPDQLLEQYESEYRAAQAAWQENDENRLTLARSLHRIEGAMTALRVLGASTPAMRLAAQKAQAEAVAKAGTLEALKREGLVAEGASPLTAADVVGSP